MELFFVGSNGSAGLAIFHNPAWVLEADVINPLSIVAGLDEIKHIVCALCPVYEAI